MLQTEPHPYITFSSPLVKFFPYCKSGISNLIFSLAKLFFKKLEEVKLGKSVLLIALVYSLIDEFGQCNSVDMHFSGY